MELANRVQSLTPSSTLAITAQAKALKAEGHDVIGLGAGEPDFNTPAHILDAAKRAMDEGLTKYTPAGGIPELKNAISAKLKRDQNLTYTNEQIIVTTGAKHALFTLFQVLLNKGDEVIVPAPYWVSYPEQIKLAEGKPVIVTADESNNFKITPEQLKASISEHTKAVVINSPSNPTGMMYSEKELQALGQVCLDNDILIISDEIYEKLVYTSEEHISIAQLSEELYNQTVIINGVSKSHSMTGWRIGFAAGNKTIIKAMSNMASHSTSNPTSIAQYAALAAYIGSDEDVTKMREAFKERLDVLYDKLTSIPGVECVKPSGAFYLFPNVQKAAESGGFSDVDEWVKALLDQEKVALVPGSGFGSPQNVRLSYATSLDQLEKAADRIKQFVNNHQS
ncbi:pyridoxal phosphate-dependent aminotransferase [Halobacillus halophilus]|uniref:Aminotransferase n=1 Tax=Halobacillus halophilus (strain ATCC 35676 / DSM 2266 / JCM 20832 / KCTC 3685 / LMG 17431 / NBRC 102448 / NCIMB 2269) TaxID=866895 RepID=I0JN76_HALH3|nr:pyridoxal phosphate-dependent aminotransferase [Halobacillus halophilus]ASF39659.1 pyridoxal phosphate-dependent aminotransferase [Halobacillus halophilus]CCG45596.1 aspartate aminotransferase [Halobacillus halophilus DSM 2266]